MFYLTASAKKVTKCRTKQTARNTEPRMSTGGKAPRKQVPTSDENKGLHLNL